MRIPSAPAARSASASPVTKDIPKEKGVDLRNAKGMAPLMAAVASGNEALAFELVRWKATVNLVLKVSGKADRTAMDMAACAKRTDILENLKRNGGYGLCEKQEYGDGFQKKSRRKR